MPDVEFDIAFSGHENILATHSRTIEITTDEKLTLQGDCIVGVGSKIGCGQIPPKIKKKIQESNSKIKIMIQVENHSFEINGEGNPNLELIHPSDIVIRKSSFVCPRTLAINCDKSAEDIPREIIRILRDPKTKGIFKILIG